MEFTLIGGGGHTQSLLNMLPEGFTPKGYTDFAPKDGIDLPWLGPDSEATGPIHIAVALGADDSLAARRSLIDRFASGNQFVTLVAKSAIIAGGTSIGDGSAVMHGAIINGATIGRNCIINTGAIIEHGVKLGENCLIGPGAIICGGVTVGNDVVIGAGATVRNGVMIASGAIIGMGAVVTSSIDIPGRYVGIPAAKLHD